MTLVGAAARPASVGARLSFAPIGTDPPAAGLWREVGDLVAKLGFDVAPWQAAVLARTFGVAAEEAAEALRRTTALSAEDAEWVVALALSLGEGDVAEDPRGRALRLRHQRGTGPSRDVVRQRRPRRVP